MSFRNLVGGTNVVFLIGGIYFAAIAISHESTIYTFIPAVLCFVSFGLGVKSDWILSAPWRVATSVLAIVLLVVQVAANLSVESSTDYYMLSSTIINGIFLILFLGVLLSALKGVTTAREEEEEKGKPLQKQSGLS